MGGYWSKLVPRAAFGGAFGWPKRPSRMGTKIKGLLKGIKQLSQIFVYREPEMEIGYPTDVRHVVHVDLDDSSVTPPSWMKEFKTVPEFSSTSLANFGQRDVVVSWASGDFQTPEELVRRGPDELVGSPARETPQKTSRRRKSKGSSGSRSSKPPKPKPSNTDKQM